MKNTTKEPTNCYVAPFEITDEEILSAVKESKRKTKKAFKCIFVPEKRIVSHCVNVFTEKTENGKRVEHVYCTGYSTSELVTLARLQHILNNLDNGENVVDCEYKREIQVSKSFDYKKVVKRLW